MSQPRTRASAPARRRSVPSSLARRVRELTAALAAEHAILARLHRQVVIDPERGPAEVESALRAGRAALRTARRGA